MDIDVQTFDAGRAVRVRPKGRLHVHSVRDVHETLDELAEDPSIQRVVLDFTDVTGLDSSGIAALSVALDRLRGEGKTLVGEHLSDDQRSALDLMSRDDETSTDESIEVSPGFFEWIGDNAFDARDELSDFYETLTEIVFSVVEFFKGKFPPKGSVTEQSVRIGVDSLPIILLLSFLLGLILAFQSAHQLRQFGADIYVANLITLSMVREFGPMMTAIILAGRSGSSMAAELGTMKIQEEVDALKTMGIDPTRYLLLPRMIAISIVQPALSLMSMAIGIFGGFIIARLYLDLTPAIFLNKAAGAVDMGDFSHGLSKSLVFAWLVGVIACYSGMTVQKGAAGVGRATTRAVV
ncbi:MAG: MlaE family lipid ABC transporter permease subunit, partial [Bradymonadaceae bacterium]